MKNIPDERHCRSLMIRYAMLPNIVEHSFRVCQVATFLARALNDHGRSLHIELIKAASLLHDITKTRGIKTKENHAETGGALLTSLGYPEVGKIAYGHVQLDADEIARPLTELHVVNYADKRVMHDRVVSLEARFEDLYVRYGSRPGAEPRLKAMYERAVALEKKIFARLDCTPPHLEDFNELPSFDLTNVPKSLTRDR